ncbi:hypothetical protein MOKP101_38780 [Mycobacterium avium subsp. hominissuis]
MTAAADLLDAVRGAPNLQGALCVGRAELFDAVEDPGAVDVCISICLECPAYAACRAWAASLPEDHVHGVVGGLVREWVSPNQRWRQRQGAA